jgi:hypothetical protein
MVLSSVKKDGGLKVWTAQEIWVPGLYPLSPELQLQVCHDGASLHATCTQREEGMGACH